LFDLETCSKVIEDGAIRQNTYDFLLVFYSNFGRISCRFCATFNFMPNGNDLAGRLWPSNDSGGQIGSPPKWKHLETGQRLTFGKNFM